MNLERVYQQCCRASQDLLRGLEAKDLALIERQVRQLRRYLAHRERSEDDIEGAYSLMRLEQLDVLDGVVASMEQSLDSMKQAAQTEFERILSTEDLIRHLTCPQVNSHSTSLPIC